MTKLTGASPLPGCPLWLSFLSWATDGDKKLEQFLQRLAGYSLTESAREQALFFFHGRGGNGKGVFLQTLTGVLGTYAITATMEAFTESKHDRHPTEIAMMNGARLVVAQETDEGRRWAEGRIMGLTGGDRISSRFMHKDFFEFTPKFTLIMAGNHLPGLNSVNPAKKRRLRIIPFRASIDEKEKDPDLVSKLEAEWGGILQWAIDGCLEWQRIGLVPPPVVRKATDHYFEAEDSVGRWLSECCVTGATCRDSSARLYQSWSHWAARAGEAPKPQKLLSQELCNRGFKQKRLTGGYAGFLGIELKPPGMVNDASQDGE
jgi:putative DNA primase/helicase